MNTKSILSFGALALVCFTMLSGCIGQRLDRTSGRLGGDYELLRQRQEIYSNLLSNSDTDAWHEQRKKILLATGDRVFDKDFARVFDSLVLALASLESTVNNMERQSGYIAASGITLPSAEGRAMGREAVNEWCRLNGIDCSILDPTPSGFGGVMESRLVGIGGAIPMLNGGGGGLTFQLVKMGDDQTKVKLRFSGVNYPRAVETYYKLVWQAVDKQIFVDKNIEGAVEKRH